MGVDSTGIDYMAPALASSDLMASSRCVMRRSWRECAFYWLQEGRTGQTNVANTGRLNEESVDHWANVDAASGTCIEFVVSGATVLWRLQFVLTGSLRDLPRYLDGGGHEPSFNSVLPKVKNTIVGAIVVVVGSIAD